MKKTILISLMLLLQVVCFGKEILLQGEIIDSKTNQGVPFASIEVKGKNSGVMCDEKGHFSIGINNKNETLIIRSLGYTTRKFNPKSTNISQRIEIKESPRQLSEITIKEFIPKGIYMNPIENVQGTILSFFTNLVQKNISTSC